MTYSSPDWLENIIQQIVRRAEGVFLWVSLAVKDQIRGIREEDSPEQLEERLRCLPNEIEKIYARMLSQIEKPYWREAALILQMAIRFGTLSLLDILLLSREPLDEMLYSPNAIPEEELVASSLSIRKKIVTICGGLLEVNENKYMESADRVSDWTIEASTDFFQGEATHDKVFELKSGFTIEFVHRTAFDFMQDPATGGVFLKTKTPPHFYPCVSYVKILLVNTRLFGFKRGALDFEGKFGIMTLTSEAECLTGVAQMRLCELIDQTMARIDRNRPNWHPDSYWCVHWGPLSRRFGQEDKSDTEFDCELYPDTDAGSPSSSVESFYSVDSLPATHATWTMLRGKANILMILAAAFDLYLSVQHMLDRRQVPLEEETVNCLLEVSVIFDGWGFSDFKNRMDLRLTDELLKRGGNPNIGLWSSSQTAWRHFLMMMYRNLRDDHHMHRWSQDDLAELRQAYMRTIVTFVENGADLKSSCEVWFHANGRKVEVPGYPEVETISFHVSLSAFAVFDICFRDQPHSSHVRDLFKAKGGLDRPRYDRIEVHRDQPSGSRSLLLSGQESVSFVDAFEKDLSNVQVRKQFWKSIWDVLPDLERRISDSLASDL